MYPCSLIIQVVQKNLRLVRVSVQSDHTGHVEKPQVSTCRNLRLVRVSLQSDHTCRTKKPQVNTCIRAVRSYRSCREISG